MSFAQTLVVSLILIWLLGLPQIRTQSNSTSFRLARSLDKILQHHAYKAFVNPKTGPPYAGNVPANLTGVKIYVMRLRSGSLRSRGVCKYNEFGIPTQVVEYPYVERLALVYQNLGNFSEIYYPPPDGYIYLTPVLGLLAYNASNLLATNLPELDIRASGDPISIEFKNVSLGMNPMCVYFGLEAGFRLTNLSLINRCYTFGQGHFSIVGEFVAVASHSRDAKGDNSRVGTIVGFVVGGGLGSLIIVGALVICMMKCKGMKKMKLMDKASNEGEPLRMITVGNTSAPLAAMTRTEPTLEQYNTP